MTGGRLSSHEKLQHASLERQVMHRLVSVRQVNNASPRRTTLDAGLRYARRIGHFANVQTLPELDIRLVLRKRTSYLSKMSLHLVNRSERRRQQWNEIRYIQTRA